MFTRGLTLRLCSCLLSLALPLSAGVVHAAGEAPNSAPAARCAEGLVSCNGSCRHLDSDVANCGVCGSQCPSGSICRAGACGVAPRRASTDSLSPMRLGLAVSLGLLTTRQTPVAARPANEQPDSGYDGRLFSAGFGVNFRLGVQLTKWLAIDGHISAQSSVFVGDAHGAILLELAPIRPLAISFGAGVGGLYRWHLFNTSPTANFASGIARVEGRIDIADGSPGPPPELTFGVEGVLGKTHGSSNQQVTGARYVPEGTPVVGARLFVGVLFR